MKTRDPLDLLTDCLEEGQYPIASPKLLADLWRLSGSSKLQGMWADLDVIVANTRELAAGKDLSGIDADRLEVIIKTDARVQWLIEYFSYCAPSLPFEVRRVLFLLAVTAHDEGAITPVEGDFASRFLPPSFVSLFPLLTKPFRTASICIAAEELGQRALDEAQRRGQSHIGRYAVDLVRLQAHRAEQSAERIRETVKTTIRITQSDLRKRALMGMARAVADGEGSRLGDLVCAKTFEAIAELVKGHDLINLTVKPETLDIFAELAVNRIVDQAKRAMADKRVGDVDADVDVDQLPAQGTPEGRIRLARIIAAMRDLPGREREISRLVLEERTTGEIGSALGMQPAAARKAISRLRQRLRLVG